MPKSEPNNTLASYKCGGCKQKILYTKENGFPDKCPECGYGHGSRDKYDIPAVVKLNLNELGG